MKEIKIIKLHIENFKGFEYKTFEFNGKSADIFGTNETGKTTIADAFYWCLFEKDSLGATDFAIKPKDKITGEDKHNLLTKVILTLLVNNQTLKLERTYEEVYTRKRGSLEETFSGHTSNYFVNDIPKKKSEYNEVVRELLDEELFKTLTNVNYFNNLKWKEQRDILVTLVKDFDFYSLLQDAKFIDLKEILLNDKTIKVDELIKSYKSKNTLLNKELTAIPIQIQTLSNSLEDLNIMYSAVELEKIIKEKENELLSLNSKKQELDKGLIDYELENKISSLKAEVKANLIKIQEILKQVEQRLKSNLQDKEIKLLELNNAIARENMALKNFASNKTLLENQREELYQRYDKVAESVFTGGTCSYCGQALPEEQTNELREKFNLNKSQELESITQKGLSINAELKNIETSYKASFKAKEENQKEFNKLELEKKVIADLLNEFANRNYDKALTEKETKDITALLDLNDNYNLEVDKLEHNKAATAVDTSERDKLNADIFALEKTIDSLKEQKTLIGVKNNTIEKINTLNDKIKTIQVKYEYNLSIITQAEEYSRLKAGVLEDSINSHFKLIKFKLFNEQINGGIEETCIATVNGVPYTSINNAARINAGLDIINTLQEIYQVKAPIFIDNAESVVEVLGMNSQLIKLYVSENDKTLRVKSQ